MERVEQPPSSLPLAAGLAIEKAQRARRTAVAAPLLLRTSLAAVFIAHGAQKAFGVFGGAGLSGTAQGFAAMGLKPALFLAILATVLELFGGMALLAGAFTRPVAGLLTLEMLFALFAVHAPNGFFLNFACTPGRGHGIEYNLVLAASLGALALLGPGRLSYDAEKAARLRRQLRFEGPLPSSPPAGPRSP